MIIKKYLVIFNKGSVVYETLHTNVENFIRAKTISGMFKVSDDEFIPVSNIRRVVNAKQLIKDKQESLEQIYSLMELNCKEKSLLDKLEDREKIVFLIDKLDVKVRKNAIITKQFYSKEIEILLDIIDNLALINK